MPSHWPAQWPAILIPKTLDLSSVRFLLPRWALRLEDFLRYLATVQPDSRDPQFLDALPVSQDYNVILTARNRGSLPSALWFSSYVIYM